MSSIGADLIYVCSGSAILTLPTALHSNAEYNIKRCWRIVWRPSSLIISIIHMPSRVYLGLWAHGVSGVHTCHCFWVVSLFKVFISCLKPLREKAVSELNKCCLRLVWQMLREELCTRKPTPSTWHKHNEDKSQFKKTAYHYNERIFIFAV